MAVTTAKRSIKRTARVAGVLYLAIFVVAPFPFLIGRSAIPMGGSAAETAAAINGSQTLFRAGMATESIIFFVEIVLAALLYVLLRPVSQPLSLAAAFSRLAEAVIQGVNLATSALVLLLIGGAEYLTVFEPDQLAALGALFLEANGFVILLWGLFFGFHLMLLGYLVYKSGFWPRVLGILLMAASFGYLVQSYGHIVVPQYDPALSTLVIVLAVPAELAFTVWLLWKGIDVDRWEARANEVG